MLKSCSHKNPQCVNSCHKNPPNIILKRFFELILVKIRCSLNPKAQVVNKAQWQLSPELYFPEFFKLQAQLLFRIQVEYSRLHWIQFSSQRNWVFPSNSNTLYLCNLMVLTFGTFKLKLFDLIDWVIFNLFFYNNGFFKLNKSPTFVLSDLVSSGRLLWVRNVRLY